MMQNIDTSDFDSNFIHRSSYYQWIVYFNKSAHSVLISLVQIDRNQITITSLEWQNGYTYIQNSSPIYWGVKLTNHVELLILMSDWLDCCLSFQEMLN